jgi:7-cyano-7-deazaguanine synthase
MQKKAVVLLSGGLDSTTVLAIAQDQGYLCHCLSFRYGQRQEIELTRAKAICARFQIAQHLVLQVGLDTIGGSALTGSFEVPKDRVVSQRKDDIPVTYVPGRNIIFLSYALSWAEVLGATDIFLGINAIDYSGYPDCRPEFLDAFAAMAKLGTKMGTQGDDIRFHAPLVHLSKKEIIQRGLELGVDYSITHSCYDPIGELACGHCDACQLRLQGFREAGLPDPVSYLL